MSQQNVEIVRQTTKALQGIDVAPFIRATLRGDTDAISPEMAAAVAAYLDSLDPDFEIDTSGLDLPGFGVLYGLEGLRELWSSWIEEWEHYSWSNSNYVAVGQHVVYDVQVHATGRSSGVEVILNHCQAYTFRNGKVVRWSLFKDRASACRALEAVGLSE
jgi:hypothetical protein